MTIIWTILVLLLMYSWFTGVFTFNLFELFPEDMTPPLIKVFAICSIGFVIGAVGVTIVYLLGRGSCDA